MARARSPAKLWEVSACDPSRSTIIRAAAAHKRAAFGMAGTCPTTEYWEVRSRDPRPRFTRAKVQGVSVVAVRACGCGPLPRTLITGRYAERPSPESSPVVAVSGGRAEAQRSRPERPALSKSAGGPARDCGPPGVGAPFDRARSLDLHSGRKEESPACRRDRARLL